MNDELALDTAGCAVTKTDELKALLRSRFCPPEWALFFEIYEGTGWSAGQGRADAVAMNLYPSRGLTVNGFELKVSRADWLRELKDGAKAETIFRYCDHWWLVVGDRAIVKANELPEPWGLIAPRKKETGYELAIVKQAPKLQAMPLSREFVAVLARRANTAATETIQERVDAATGSLQADIARLRGELQEAWRAADRDLARQVTEFEQASGINLREGWHRGKRAGEIVKAILAAGGLERQRSSAAYALDTVTRIKKDLTALLAALPEEGETL